MDVSRLEAGRLKGTFRPVNLGIMTRDLAVLFKSTIEKVRRIVFGWYGELTRIRRPSSSISLNWILRPKMYSLILSTG